MKESQQGLFGMPMKTVFDPLDIGSELIKIRPLSSVNWQDLAGALLYDDSWYGRVWNIREPKDIEKVYFDRLRLLDLKIGNPHVFLDVNENEIYGVTSFLNVEPQNKLVEIGGTWISKKWQRSFVNTEAKYLLLTYCFETLGLRRVEFRIDAANMTSQKAIARLGIHLDGVLRNRRILPSGQSADYHFYSVIDRDWPEVKGKIELLKGKYV